MNNPTSFRIIHLKFEYILLQKLYLIEKENRLHTVKPNKTESQRTVEIFCSRQVSIF